MYRQEQKLKVIRTRHVITTYRGMTAKTLKEELNKIPDDAIMLGFEDTDEANADLCLRFQKEEELTDG